jgi:hypothetical protein
MLQVHDFVNFLYTELDLRIKFSPLIQHTRWHNSTPYLLVYSMLKRLALKHGYPGWVCLTTSIWIKLTYVELTTVQNTFKDKGFHGTPKLQAAKPQGSGFRNKLSGPSGPEHADVSYFELPVRRHRTQPILGHWTQKCVRSDIDPVFPSQIHVTSRM